MSVKEETGAETGTDGKADFSHLYVQPDPREYHRELGQLDYQIPQQAAAAFAAAHRAQVAEGTAGTILDVCCSYGINGALLSTDLTETALRTRYSEPALAGLGPEELAEADRAFIAEHRRADAPTVVGLDISAEAIAYSTAVGLLQDGWVEDLEEHDASASFAAGMSDVSQIIITGGVGYITEKTFDRILRAFPEGRGPWIVAFVLRVYPYDTIEQTLAEHGLVTEKLEGRTFEQRRFASPEEQSAAVSKLHGMGIDTTGLEDEGWYHCDLFVSRPQADVDAQPLPELLAAHGGL